MNWSRHTLMVVLGRLLVLAVIMLGAEFGVRSGFLSQLFFSSPTRNLPAHSRLSSSRARWLWNVGVTVSETLLGLVAGSLVGMAVGLVLPQSRTLSRVVEPFLMVLNGIPVIVIAPLFILWLGLGTTLQDRHQRVYRVLRDVHSGLYRVAATRTAFVDALRVMGASRWQIFWKVVVPSSMPSVYTGLKIGSGLALIGAVIGEFVASRSGLGHMILYASGTLDTPTLYLGIIALACSPPILSFAVDAMGPLLVHWRFADEK